MSTDGHLPIVGRRIRFTGRHPWAGCTGKVEAILTPAIVNRPGARVKLDIEDRGAPPARCYVFDRNDWEPADDVKG